MTDSNRDEKGRMLPGHPFYKSQNGIKNGAKKTVAGEVRDALKLAEDAMPKLIQDMINDSQNPEINANVRQQCREYLIDRIYGKANQPLSNKDGGSVASFVFVMPDGLRRTAQDLVNSSG